MYSEIGGGDEQGGDTSSRRRLLRPLLFALLCVLVDALPVWLRGYGLGGKVVVRCREGHLFTTIWIPGATVKALRFGFWRFQRCPVGHHWSIVVPVKRSELTRREQRFARDHEDVRVP
jgi:hypothetical protein